MGVDVAHLVQEAAGDTDDQVVDDGADGTEGSDTLASTVVQLDRDNVLLGAAEGDGNVGEVLNELAAGTLDGHNTRTNVNLHCRENITNQSQFFFFCMSFAPSTSFQKPEKGSCVSLLACRILQGMVWSCREAVVPIHSHVRCPRYWVRRIPPFPQFPRKTEKVACSPLSGMGSRSSE